MLFRSANLRVLQQDGTLVPATRPPTVRELMTHTAGLSYSFMNAPGIVDAYRTAGVTDGLPPTSQARRRRGGWPRRR